MPRTHKSGLTDDEVITVWGHVLEGTARINAEIEAHLSEIFDVPTSYFEVLLRLHRTPDHQLPMTQLATEVSFSSGGFTKLADRMEQAGYVARSSCPNDRRVTWIGLTTLGSATITDATLQHAAWLRTHVIEPIGEEAAQIVSDAMRTLRDGKLV